jgi:hypothetical protein
VPVLGSQCSSAEGGESRSAQAGDAYLGPGSWVVSIGYRHQLSHRHFVGDVEQTTRAKQKTEIVNDINLLDVGVTYAFNQRYNLTLSVPFLIASRTRPATLDQLRGIPNAPDQVFHTGGIGDITLTGRMWLVRPPAENKQNISIGVGLKVPTGEPGAKDTVLTPTGRVTSVVDQSVQPGDGGWGFTVDVQAFKVVRRATLFVSGVYLFNPQDTNGVLTGRSNKFESVMSVADQYLGRAGVVYPFPKVRGLALSMGIRDEGVPARDILGKSNGFRRPGYAVDVEPGLIYSRGKQSWSVFGPVPFHRDRTRSTADKHTGGHGDAAFADYVLLVGYSRRL